MEMVARFVLFVQKKNNLRGLFRLLSAHSILSECRIKKHLKLSKVLDIEFCTNACQITISSFMNLILKLRSMLSKKEYNFITII